MLRATARGAGHAAVRTAVRGDDRAAIGAARAGWQAAPGLGGTVIVAERESVVVAADAALYYRADLRAAILGQGVAAAGDDPAELIAASYLAFGDAAVGRLEGDYAFVLWDGRRRSVLAARDHGGRRPLYYAALGDTLVIASSIAGVLAHPACPRALNLAAIAETAAGFLGATSETAHAAVRRLGAGCLLARGADGRVSVARHWESPTFERPSGLGFDAAARALRGLLEDAVAERLPNGGTTAVFMSGGWDSPPVFAAGQSALARGRAPGARLVPVSMSYPVGDPGREDETIAQIAARWQTRPHWRDVEAVPLFDQPAARAAVRDEPLAHLYEAWNRSLMHGARDVGAHVALDGIGGDALFQVSPVYLADLLAGGRWPALLREWRRSPVRAGGARAFWSWAVRPAIPRALLPLATRLRGGRPFADYLRRSPPAWLRADFVAEHALADRGAVALGRRPGESRSALESRWHFTAGWAPSLLGALADVALDYEVELRSPLADRRVIAFAATRPRAERRSMGETKRLVRAAMGGLLPDAVLAPRAHRTGLTSGYFARRVAAELPAIVEHDLRSVALADLAVVDADALRRAAADVVRHPAGPGAVPLWFTLQAEWWVRARLAGADSRGRRHGPIVGET